MAVKKKKQRNQVVNIASGDFSNQCYLNRQKHFLRCCLDQIQETAEACGYCFGEVDNCMRVEDIPFSVRLAFTQAVEIALSEKYKTNAYGDGLFWVNTLLELLADMGVHLQVKKGETNQTAVNISHLVDDTHIRYEAWEQESLFAAIQVAIQKHGFHIVKGKGKHFLSFELAEALHYWASFFWSIGGTMWFDNHTFGYGKHVMAGFLAWLSCEGLQIKKNSGKTLTEDITVFTFQNNFFRSKALLEEPNFLRPLYSLQAMALTLGFQFVRVAESDRSLTTQPIIKRQNNAYSKSYSCSDCKTPFTTL